MKQHTLDHKKYAQLARQVAAEGCVLLRNENNALPIRNGDKVAVFGRCAFHYYKSGLGSGGLVNTRYVVSILDALKACEGITLEEELLQIYERWIEENPIDEGHGWGTVPWSQKEMPLSKQEVQAAKSADIALVIIGRTAGEDQDNKAEEGSYLLTETEREMIKNVCRAFSRTVVILNVGNIVDMSWVEEYHPAAVMYAWQGGQEGGNGVVDVLTGRVNPCGKLTDTIARHIEDYPSTSCFGDPVKNYYKEDIYVGYRYFETCAKDKVLYPFGFGLSYSTFDISAEIKQVTKESVQVFAKVTNTGDSAGKEVVQIYVEPPQGRLGKPSRILAGFAKTAEIRPGEMQELLIECPKSYFASYDDAGITGNKDCMLLEEGEYRIYAGADVRSAACCGSYQQTEEVLEQLNEACAPVEAFERLKPIQDGTDLYKMENEPVPLRTIDPATRIDEFREQEISYIGNQGYRLADVVEGRITLDTFISQLSDEELICLFYGEGMCSPKVTPGTAGAFGGLSESLKAYGIPAMCCADGPSGIRMDCGTKAFSLPNGTAIGCTFNMELVEELFQMVGKELWKNKVDTLLGPGINIHRSPLNGRNFEYISEDPVLTGRMCTAQLNGMHAAGTTGTIKHFCANNQEQNRCEVEAVVSQRALREIYLKGYEIAVKEGNAKSIMTTYGPINGIWTAGSFDLCTTILRREWGYKGIVMTDWWGTANWEGELAEKNNRAPMVLAQNDLYMCCADALEEIGKDNVKEKLASGVIQRSDLQRNAKNILTFIMDSPAMLREMGLVEDELDAEQEEDETDYSKLSFYVMDADTASLTIGEDNGKLEGEEIQFGIEIPRDGEYELQIKIKSELSELAQLPVSVYVDNIYRNTVSFQGTNGEIEVRKVVLGYIMGKNHYIKLKRQGNGLDILQIMIAEKA